MCTKCDILPILQMIPWIHGTTFPISAKSAIISIWLAVVLKVLFVQAQCNDRRKVCQLENLTGISNTSSLISMNAIYPASCVGFCLQKAECLASTFDPTAKDCELFWADPEGTPCRPLYIKHGIILSILKSLETPCLVVRHDKCFLIQ